MKVKVGKETTFLGLDITLWGWSQAHKWRWHGDHIDLGPVSIYNLPGKGPGAWFWRMVSILVKPLRWWYHRNYVYSTKAQIKNAEWEMNHFE